MMLLSMGNIPQNRERIYIVAFRDKELFKFSAEINPLTKSIKDVIDFDGGKDEKFYYTPEKCSFYDELKRSMVTSDTIYQWRRVYVLEKIRIVQYLLYSQHGTGGHNVSVDFNS